MSETPERIWATVNGLRTGMPGVFSLRSRGDGGIDVSEIAAAHGGGGHRNAAGFQAPLGWEGDAR